MNPLDRVREKTLPCFVRINVTMNQYESICRESGDSTSQYFFLNDPKFCSNPRSRRLVEQQNSFVRSHLRAAARLPQRIIAFSKYKRSCSMQFRRLFD